MVSNPTVGAIMAKKKDLLFSDEEIAELQAMLYDARMQQHATPVPTESGWYVRQPVTPSMLKGKQRREEIGYQQQRRSSIEEQIAELQKQLSNL